MKLTEINSMTWNCQKITFLFFRQIPGFPVFGVGQCTEAGIDLMSEKLDKSKAVIFIMRQVNLAKILLLPLK